jgi:hypothetical protein
MILSWLALCKVDIIVQHDQPFPPLTHELLSRKHSLLGNLASELVDLKATSPRTMFLDLHTTFWKNNSMNSTRCVVFAVTINREAGWFISWHDHGIVSSTLGDADLV